MFGNLFRKVQKIATGSITAPVSLNSVEPDAGELLDGGTFMYPYDTCAFDNACSLPLFSALGTYQQHQTELL